MADSTAPTNPEMLDVTQLGRLLGTLVNGLIPSEREAEALAIVHAITVHVILEQERIYRLGHDAGRTAEKTQAEAHARMQQYIRETLDKVCAERAALDTMH